MAKLTLVYGGGRDDRSGRWMGIETGGWKAASGRIRRLFVRATGPSSNEEIMVSLTLLSTALMGLLVIGTFVAIARIGGRRTPPGADEHADRYSVVVKQLGEIARTPAVWSVTFVVITVGVGALAVLAVGDFGFAEGLSETLLGLTYAVVGLLLTAFVFLGAYFGTRGRGLGNAHGIAAGSFAAGLVFLVLITIQLVVGVVG